MDQVTFNEAYAASLPPAILTLMKLGVDYNNLPSTGRTAGFVGLVQAGWLIDAQIMVMGQDPYDTMLERNAAGFNSVPAFLQPWPTNPPVPPGLNYNGLVGSANQGSIIVDWPTPPAPLNPPSSPPTSPTLTLSIPIQGYPGYFEMNGDSASIPVGYTTEIGVNKYTKTAISKSPFAPGGIVTGWFQST